MSEDRAYFMSNAVTFFSPFAFSLSLLRLLFEALLLCDFPIHSSALPFQSGEPLAGTSTSPSMHCLIFLAMFLVCENILRTVEAMPERPIICQCSFTRTTAKTFQCVLPVHICTNLFHACALTPHPFSLYLFLPLNQHQSSQCLLFFQFRQFVFAKYVTFLFTLVIIFSLLRSFIFYARNYACLESF